MPQLGWVAFSPTVLGSEKIRETAYAPGPLRLSPYALYVFQLKHSGQAFLFFPRFRNKDETNFFSTNSVLKIKSGCRYFLARLPYSTSFLPWPLAFQLQSVTPKQRVVDQRIFPNAEFDFSFAYDS